MFKVVKIFRNIHYHAQLYDNYVGHDNVCKQEVTSKQLGNKHIPAFTGWIMQFAMYKKHAMPCLISRPSHPVFVACSTNAGEGLVKLSHVQWRTWTCGGVVHSWKSCKWVRYRSQTQTVPQLSARHQTVLATFLGFRKPLYSCTEVMCHTSTHPGTSLHMTQAFPHVSTASDKRWGEKAWVQGYATSVLVLAALLSKQSAQSGCSCWWLHTGWTTIHEAIFLLCKSDCCFLELA